MVLLRSAVTAALTAFSPLGSSLDIPLAGKLNSLSLSARDLLNRSTPAAPRLVPPTYD